MTRDHPALQPAALLAYATTSVAMLGTSAVSPVLPAVQGAFGVPDARIGLVMSVFTLSTALSVSVVGWLADTVGRRPVLGGSLVLFSLSGAATGLAPDFTTVLALRAVQGVGFAGTLPLVIAVISDLFEGTQAVQAHGFRVTAINLGTFLFPVVTGALVAFGWAAPFALFLLALPLGLLVLWRFPEPETGGRPEGSYARAVLVAVRRPLVALSVASGVVRFFTYFALLVYLPLLASARGLSPGEVGVVVGTIGAVKMLLAPQARRTGALGPPRLLAFLTLVGSLAVVAAFPLAGSLPGFVAVAGLYAALEGVSSPLEKTVLTRYAPANVRAGVVSSNAAAQNLGKTAGPLVVGAAAALTDLPTAVTLLGAAGAVLALGLLAAAWLAAGGPSVAAPTPADGSGPR